MAGLFPSTGNLAPHLLTLPGGAGADAGTRAAVNRGGGGSGGGGGRGGEGGTRRGRRIVVGFANVRPFIELNGTGGSPPHTQGRPVEVDSVVFGCGQYASRQC